MTGFLTHSLARWEIPLNYLSENAQAFLRVLKTLWTFKDFGYLILICRAFIKFQFQKKPTEAA